MADDASGPPRVLVVDDDIVMVRLFEMQVRRAGCEGHFFLDGAEAVAALGRVRPHLAVLDFHLPGLDGADVYRALREFPPTAAIPVIFVTAEADAEALGAIRDLGAAHVLAKPFSPRRLVTLIHALLRRR